MKLREYFLYAKKTKITTLFNNSSPLRQRSAIFEKIRWTQTAYAVLCQPHHTDTSSSFIYALIWMKTAYPCAARLTQNSIRSLRPVHTLQNGAIVELLYKVVIFVFFAYKKYSCSFIMLRLNHWWQIDYFDDVFHTFLDLDTGIYLAVNGTVTSLPVFIQNILNCVLKTNEAFTGLERHGVRD